MDPGELTADAHQKSRLVVLSRCGRRSSMGGCESCLVTLCQRLTEVLIADHLELHPRDAATDHAELLGGRLRDVDDAALDERSAVVDAHRHRAAGLQLRDAHPRTER